MKAKLARWWHVWWWGWDIAPARMIRSPLQRLLDEMRAETYDLMASFGRALLPSVVAAAHGFEQVAVRLKAGEAIEYDWRAR